ncbi:hypothetical protein [Streptococcus phocae]|nr:hypothetical protein [Streptococcus phocae]
MTKAYISYLSAGIFALYGLLAQKPIFLGLGLILVIIGVSQHLTNKK